MGMRLVQQRIVATACLLAVVAVPVFWWWPHLEWKFFLSRNQVIVPSVPVSEFKAPGKTAGWYDCRVGPLALKLPPDLIEKGDRTIGKTLTIDIKGPSMDISIHVPLKVAPGAVQGLVAVAAALHTSPIRMIADSYRESTEAFRWSMSRDELMRHATLLSLGSLFPHQDAVAAETRFDGAMEGVLVLNDRNRALYQWRTTGGDGSGFLTFYRKDGELDRDGVRDICWSVACDESRLGAQHTKKDLAKVLDEMESRTSEDGAAGRGE